MRELTGVEARRMRLVAHGLAGSDRSPADAVRHAVALQGQDLPGVLRAIAIRSAPGTSLDDVRAAFDAGGIVRSWPMRGTLFAVAPDDLASLLDWTAARIHRKSAPARAERDLDDGTVARAREVALAALQAAPRTRAQLLETWEAAGIETGRGRGSTLIAHLAIDGLVHWGRFDGAQQLLVPSEAQPTGEPEARLAAIAERYLRARGPATVDDFAWWTGLPKSVARAAIARADDIEEVAVDGVPMWLPTDAEVPPTAPDVVLAPAFDEWILGYRDRSLVASPEVLAAVVPGGNGVFRPTVLVDGVAVGTWRIPAARSKAAVDPVLELVERVPAATRRRIDAALAAWPHR